MHGCKRTIGALGALNFAIDKSYFDSLGLLTNGARHRQGQT
jgi:hypothetical protein